MTYYVVLVNGVPMEVTQHFWRAEKAQQELTTPGREAYILPVEPKDSGYLDAEEYSGFSDEEETNPQMTLPFDLSEPPTTEETADRYAEILEGLKD